MTLPDERFRAVKQVRQFLYSLADPKAIAGIPKEIRQRARDLLRHYPDDFDLINAANLAPSVFQEQMEPVTRLFEQYQQSRDKS